MGIKFRKDWKVEECKINDIVRWNENLIKKMGKK